MESTWAEVSYWKINSNFGCVRSIIECEEVIDEYEYATCTSFVQVRSTKNFGSFDLSVAPSVTVHQYRKQLFQAPGYSRTLTCEAKGNPVPTEEQILWFKGGSSLVDSNKFIKESYFGSNYVMMKLTVRDITEADYGVYNCYAENSEGNGENTVTLSRTEGYVSDRELFQGSSRGSSLIAVSITTLVMLIGTALLHLC